MLCTVHARTLEPAESCEEIAPGFGPEKPYAAITRDRGLEELCSEITCVKTHTESIRQRTFSVFLLAGALCRMRIEPIDHGGSNYLAAYFLGVLLESFIALIPCILQVSVAPTHIPASAAVKLMHTHKQTDATFPAPLCSLQVLGMSFLLIHRTLLPRPVLPRIY